jgi:hypothetical protein
MKWQGIGPNLQILCLEEISNDHVLCAKQLVWYRHDSIQATTKADCAQEYTEFLLKNAVAASALHTNPSCHDGFAWPAEEKFTIRPSDSSQRFAALALKGLSSGSCVSQTFRSMLTIQHYKESLSRAYITAIVGSARQQLKWGSEYDYGVDGQVKKITNRNGRRTETGFGFDFQAKASTDWKLHDEQIIYDLEVDNYNDLAQRSEDDRAMPLILILMCLDSEEGRWLDVDTDRLILQKCSYWLQISSGFSSNQCSQRVKIPARNTFSPDTVIQLLDDIESGRVLP